MTNGSGVLEQTKANLLNKYLTLEGKEQFTEKTVVMPFSPLRPTFKKYSDKIVAISGASFGADGIEGIATDGGLKYYITIEEYISIWPKLMPLHDTIFTKERQKEVTKQVLKRIPHLDTTQPVPVNAVFILSDPLQWECNI